MDDELHVPAVVTLQEISGNPEPEAGCTSFSTCTSFAN